MGAKITGTGHYLPEHIVTNVDLEKRIDTSDEWIVRRTGIRTRFLLNPDEDPALMGVEAAKEALVRANMTPDQIDLLIVATNFPDMICPGSAPFVSAGLGLAQTPFFDLKAGCSGFIYGLAITNALITTRLYSRVLLVGSEALSRVINWSDRKTCVLFGDGAGAALLEPAQEGEGILGTAIYGDPTKALLLRVPAGGTKLPASQDTLAAKEHTLKMEGAGVYRSAVPMMEQSTRMALADAGLQLSDVDWLIPHQANIRIIKSLTRRLEFDPARVVVNLDRTANTSTASIPIALDEAIRSGKIKSGDSVVLTAFGAGATYGAVVLRM
jgi:3-oxoacyl-[acyl-carrier-protein] synthase-3